MKKIAIIGCGAAGMMAAIAASGNGNEVTIFERNEKAGKKIYITGKGRCNVTNASDIDVIFNNIVTNRKFMYSSLYTFDNNMVMDFFEKAGIPLKVERGERVFPVSDRASDIIKGLTTTLRDKNVKIMYNTRVKELIVEDNTVKEDGLYIYRAKIKENDFTVEKITNHVEYEKISRAYMEMDEMTEE